MEQSKGVGLRPSVLRVVTRGAAQDTILYHNELIKSENLQSIGQ